MKCRVLLPLSAVLLLGTATQLHAQSRSERRMLAYAKKMDVRYLDHSLPSQTFASWFSRVVGSGSRIKWELNDCGERTGGTADLERDLPICAGVEALRKDGRKVVIAFCIGTLKKGLIKGRSGIYFLGIERGDQDQRVSNLHELPAALKKN